VKSKPVKKKSAAKPAKAKAKALPKKAAPVKKAAPKVKKPAAKAAKPVKAKKPASKPAAKTPAKASAKPAAKAAVTKAVTKVVKPAAKPAPKAQVPAKAGKAAPVVKAKAPAKEVAKATKVAPVVKDVVAPVVKPEKAEKAEKVAKVKPEKLTKAEKAAKAAAAAAPAEIFPALDPSVKRPAKPFFLEVKPGVERVIKRGDKSAASPVLDIQARRKGPAAEESSEELAERIERELQSQSFLKRNRMRPQLCTKCGINAVAPRFTIDRELGYCDPCAEILHLGETKEARRMEFNLALKKEEGAEGEAGAEDEEPSPDEVEDVPDED
jgi:hypothetical protein